MISKGKLPEQPGGGFLPLPMVPMKDEPVWEYRQLVRNLARESAPSESELNALGAEGWELSGILSDSPFVYFYFKRFVG